MSLSVPQFPILDEPMLVARQPDYHLPLEEWNRAVRSAQALADREAQMPLRRRMASWLKATELNQDS